jgi:hypothetical protein
MSGIGRAVKRWLSLVLRAGLVLGLLIVVGGWSWFWHAEGPPADENGQASNLRWYGKGYQEGAEAGRSFNFNHEQHVVEEELDCTECHAGAEEEARAGMPAEKVCADCHDETERGGEDRSGCLKCHNVAAQNPACSEDDCPADQFPEIKVKIGPQPYRNLRYVEEPGEEGEAKGFSHAVHKQAEIACKDCHAGIAEQAGMPLPSGRFMPRPRRCFDCHTKELRNFSHALHQGKEIECDACHEQAPEDAKDWTTPLPEGVVVPQGIPTSTPEVCADCHQPVVSECQTCHVPGSYDTKVAAPSHRGNWVNFHGSAAKLNAAGQHGKDCLTCHVKNDCESCHNTQPPKDHTNFWRTRGHGLMAAGNKERCDNCHRQDFCVACHNETAPRTHIGGWERFRHCPWCHVDSSFSGSQDNCSVCHKVIPHASAPHRINAAVSNCFGSGCHSPATGRAPAP